MAEIGTDAAGRLDACTASRAWLRAVALAGAASSDARSARPAATAAGAVEPDSGRALPGGLQVSQEAHGGAPERADVVHEPHLVTGGRGCDPVSCSGGAHAGEPSVMILSRSGHREGSRMNRGCLGC